MTKLQFHPLEEKSFGNREDQSAGTGATMASKKTMTILSVVVDVTIWVAVSLAGLVLAYNLTGVEPTQRGFFCDDQTIQYPYRPDSVSDSLVVIVSVMIPAAVIFIVECVHVYTQRKKLAKSERSQLLCLVTKLYRVIGIFLAGGSFTIVTTEVLKLVSGRLRPHYFSVCQANFTKVNCSLGYIMPPDDFCDNTDIKMLLDARKSFPSGHASLSAYGAIFLLIFLQRRFIWRQFKLIPPLLQMGVFCVGVYICISRVTDNKHHVTDVIGGAVLGVVFAIFMVVCVWDVSLQKKDNPDVTSYAFNPTTNGGPHSDMYTTSEIKQRNNIGAVI